MQCPALAHCCLITMCLLKCRFNVSAFQPGGALDPEQEQLEEILKLSAEEAKQNIDGAAVAEQKQLEEVLRLSSEGAKRQSARLSKENMEFQLAVRKSNLKYDWEKKRQDTKGYQNRYPSGTQAAFGRGSQVPMASGNSINLLGLLGNSASPVNGCNSNRSHVDLAGSQFHVITPLGRRPPGASGISRRLDVRPPQLAEPFFPRLVDQASFSREKVLPQRHFDNTNRLDNEFRLAEGHFLRMLDSRGITQNRPKIAFVEVISNAALERKFEDMKARLNNEQAPSNEILAYHGTKVENIDSILKNNLQLQYAKRQAHGKGIYFSEFPDVSIGYGQGLLLCRLLPGKEFVDSSGRNIPQGYHSKKVQPQASAMDSGQMIIVENSDQILPAYVIHLKNNPALRPF